MEQQTQQWGGRAIGTREAVLNVILGGVTPPLGGVTPPALRPHPAHGCSITRPLRRTPLQKTVVKTKFAATKKYSRQASDKL